VAQHAKTKFGHWPVRWPIRYVSSGHAAVVMIHNAQTYKQARWIAAVSVQMINANHAERDHVEFANGVGMTA
jgi:hypothetical protein